MKLSRSLAAKLLVAIILISTISIATIATIGYFSSSAALQENSFNQLTSVREIKAQQVESHFDHIKGQIITFSEDRMIVEAMREFKKAFFDNDHISSAPTTTQHLWQLQVQNYYEGEFLPRLQSNSEQSIDNDLYLPESIGSIYWQYQYIANNPNPIGEKQNLNNSQDGTVYSSVHARYHPIIRNFLGWFGYYDIFLVDHETGYIVYSVFKEVDFATSLTSGPHKNSNLAKAARKASQSRETSLVHLEDFALYHPSYNAPASFIASPIFDQDKQIGTLIFQMPVDKIDRILRGNKQWIAEGLGESGESYLVGPDFKMRSNSRFFVEDPSGYIENLRAAQVAPASVNQLQKLNTTILTQEIKTQATEAALGGESSTGLIKGFRGVSVLSSYKPLDIEGLNWVMLSEIDRAEISAPVTGLAIRYLIFTLAMLSLVTGVSIYFTRSFIKPIITIKDASLKVAYGNYDVELEIGRKDELGHLAKSFNTMVASIRNWRHALLEEHKHVEQKEALMRAASSMAKLGSWEWHIESGKYSCTDEMLKICGISNADFDGTAESLFKNVHPEDKEGVLQAIKLQSAEAPQPPQFRIVYEDGQSINMWMIIDRKVDEENNLTYMMGIAQDITDRIEEEERLGSILASMPDGFIAIDEQGKIVLANSQMQEIFEYSEAELIGQPVSILVPEDQRAGHDAHLASFFQNPKVRPMGAGLNLEGQKKDGTRMAIEINLSSFSSSEGTLGLAVVRDITDRLEEEKRLSSILNSMPDGFIAIDEQGKIVLANSQMQEIFEYSEAELIGQPVSILVPEDQRAGHDAHLASFFQNPKVRPMGAGLNLEGQKKDGTRMAIEINLSSFSSSEGTLGLAVVRDITDRLEEEKRLSSILNAIPDGFLAVNEEGKIVLINEQTQKIFGYTQNELVGQPITMLVPEDKRSGHDVHVTSYWGNAKRRPMGAGPNLQGLKKDGSKFSIEINLRPFESKEGTLVLAVIRDITERKALESQLAQAQKLESIGQLAAGVAHEINTPIQYVGDNTRFIQEAFGEIDEIIDSYTDLLDQAKAGMLTLEMVAKLEQDIEDADLEYLAAEVPNAIEQSLEGISRVSTIVRAMKEFAHPGQETKMLSDINRAITSTMTVAKNEWKYVADTELNLAENLPRVPCFIDRLNQVFLNLIVNAAHAIEEKLPAESSEKGLITLGTSASEDWIEIRITDTGGGIPEHVQSKIFDPFFTTKQVGKGTGQGLAIAHSVVVDTHGGELFFETQSGVGTTFTIRLPIEERTGNAKEENTMAEEENKGGPQEESLDNEVLG